MIDAALQSRILKELEYSNLTTTQLVRRLSVGITRLSPELKHLEKDGKIKRVMRQDEEVWELT